jgi:hypothetical protein
MDKITFKTLVGVKWKSRHFHVIGEGFTTKEGTRIVLFSWTFPEDVPYEEGVQQIDYQFDTDCLRTVDASDHRYICTQLVDLDWQPEPPESLRRDT